MTGSVATPTALSGCTAIDVFNPEHGDLIGHRFSTPERVCYGRAFYPALPSPHDTKPLSPYSSEYLQRVMKAIFPAYPIYLRSTPKSFPMLQTHLSISGPLLLDVTVSR